MDMIFDTATGQLSIDATDAHPWGADLRAVVKRHGQVVNMKRIQMRLTITADGETVTDLQLPPPGVRYCKTSQDTLATSRARWKPDQQIEVEAWCRTTTGDELTASESFVAPRPPQPYPSWAWQDGRWQAPVPRPEGEYSWDEDAGAWKPAPEDDDQRGR